MTADGSRLSSWLACDDEDLNELKKLGRKIKQAKMLRVVTAGTAGKITTEYRKSSIGNWDKA